MPACSTRHRSTSLKSAAPVRSKFLNYVCANDIDQPVGTIVYTECLNKHGGIECDFTVTRLANDRFFIVTGTGFRTARPLMAFAEHAGRRHPSPLKT